MFKFTVNEKEYSVKFGFNDFCDTDLIDRVKTIGEMFSGNEEENEDSGFEKIKDLFTVTRELLYIGLRRKNPMDSLQDVGDLMDDYVEENASDEEDSEKKGLLEMFGMLVTELTEQGFLSEILGAAKTETEKKVVPMDHQKKRTTTKKK